MKKSKAKKPKVVDQREAQPLISFRIRVRREQWYDGMRSVVYAGDFRDTIDTGLIGFRDPKRAKKFATILTKALHAGLEGAKLLKY